MLMDLKGKSFLTLKDFSRSEIQYLLDLALRLKQKKNSGTKGKLLEGKNIALIFEKPSTRTRCAFTVAAVDEGAHPEYLGVQDIQLGHKESVEDTARVLGRMFDGILFRGFSQSTVEKLSKYSQVPVWNGLTDEYHPTQVLADFLTMMEHKGGLQGQKFVYVGDGRNNMARSLMIGSAKMGLDFTIVAPKELWPLQEWIEECQSYIQEQRNQIIITDQIHTGVLEADIIYTDVWCSMGEEDKAAERIKLLRPYQINKEMIEATGNEEVIFMHCLPAVKGNEVTTEVFEGKHSVVFDQAENRMHTIKAVLVATLSENLS